MKAREAANSWTQGDWVLYRHGSSGPWFITLRLENASESSLEVLLAHGRHLQAFVNKDAWPEGNGPGSDLTKNGVVVSLELTVEGFRQLDRVIAHWHLQDSSGWARLPVRSFPRGDVLVHGGPEAYLLEASSLGATPIRCMLLGQIDAATAARIQEEFPGRTLTTREVVDSRIENPKLINHTGVIDTDLRMGAMKLHSFYAALDRRYHWAFATSSLESSREVPLIRIESECLTGHVLGSKLCDCRQQMELGLEKISASGHGALIYLRQEGRGIGLINKLKAYSKQQVEKLDTIDANLAIGVPEDARDYLIGAQILRYFGINRVRLLTNNPTKVTGLEKYGIEVVERVSHIIEPTATNQRYLETKKHRMGHLI